MQIHGSHIAHYFFKKQKIKNCPVFNKKTIFQNFLKNLEIKIYIKLIGAENNLQNLSLNFPLNLLTCITGVSGSGKSTLINDILYNSLRSKLGYKVPWIGKHTRIEGWNKIENVIMINQKSIGKTSRSNPATYVGVFTYIRELFAKCPESRIRGYSPGQFSFNVSVGHCKKCQGSGQIKIEMLFMADIFIKCSLCQGKRYTQETLQIFFKGKNIADVLDMTVSEALVFFHNQKYIYGFLKVMKDVGLGYIKLGQPATQLSGGESQRVKLALYLYRKSNGKNLYILDEPTTGLHFNDIKKLIKVFHELTRRNDTIIVIEHNLDIIKTADYIIDLGPEGGEDGGKIIVCGPQEKIINCKESYTGQALRKKINLDQKRNNEQQ